MDLNIVVLVGRLADDVMYYPEHNGVSERAVGRLTINRTPSNSGNKKYDTVQIVFWGKQAQNMAKYTSKGKELGVIGEIRTNSKPPAKPGGEWKNYTEILVRFVSYGKDSNQGKMMKAIESGVILPGMTEPNGAGPNMLGILQQNPQMIESLSEIAMRGTPLRGNAPAEESTPPPMPDLPNNEDPFAEEK